MPMKKALHIRLEAKPGNETEVEQLIQDILVCVQQEPSTSSWFSVRSGQNAFDIFEAFPDEAGREAHLNGEGARLLRERGEAILVEPPRIDKLDVIAGKTAKTMSSPV